MWNADRRQSGYLLLELLAAVFVIIMVLGGILPELQSYKKSYYRQQIRMAAAQLAGDLRLLQQEAMYNTQVNPSLDTNNNEGYSLVYSTILLRTHRFKDNGCDGVYFQKRLYSASYGPDGAPNTSGTYVLSHRSLQSCRYVVELQPVTGRVLVSEKK